MEGWRVGRFEGWRVKKIYWWESRVSSEINLVSRRVTGFIVARFDVCVDPRFRV